MRTATLTYEVVCAQINELVQSGEKITVRNVIAKTGGSTTKVMDFVKRWREESNISKFHPDLDISEELQRALLIDKSAAVAKTASAYKTQLTDLEALLQESSEIIKSQEFQLTENTKDLEELRQRLAMQSSNESSYNDKLSAQAQKINADQVLQIQMGNNLAKMGARIESADSVITELKEQLAKQQVESLQATKAKYEAESTAAIWQAKHEQLTEQMQLLLMKINKA